MTIEASKMTKQEFWTLIASCLEYCDGCPVEAQRKDNNSRDCYKDCAKALQEVYERLERESNDA
jgi:hypothetical protein